LTSVCQCAILVSHTRETAARSRKGEQDGYLQYEIVARANYGDLNCPVTFGFASAANAMAYLEQYVAEHDTTDLVLYELVHGCALPLIQYNKAIAV
jgi:hypothetical protein